MKSLFLYRSTSYDNRIPETNGIYRLHESLVGIDINLLNKRERRYIVSSYKLREFQMLQRQFGDIIKNASNLGIVITDVKLSNDDVSEDDLSNIEICIRNRDYLRLIDVVAKYCDEYECDVESISLGYKGCTFNLLAEGVLESYANDQEFQQCVIEDPGFLSFVIGKETGNSYGCY